ncbi:MAG: aminoglycoside phosphotransferase family protein [bacterium]|nr:aminoglycoside phosphotransferase family protein [bacterium]
MDQHENLVTSIVGTGVQKITPILNKGTVNQVFLVESSEGNVVVRLNNEDLVSRYEKEKWCMEKASEVGVNAPKVISVGEKDGYAYTVMSFIEGTPGDETDTTGRPLVWRELGRYARAIHSIPVAGFGLEYADMIEGDSERHWNDYLDYNIKSLTPEDKLIELGVIDIEESKRVKELFEELKKKNFTFGLNHGDLSLKNTILGADGSVYLLDWGCAEADIVPHFDIGEIKRSSELTEEDWDSFLVGYSMSREEFKGLEDDLKSRLLLLRFDKLRWAIDKKPERIEEYAKEAKSAFEFKFAPANS